ncbi:hypothetical protein QZH41_007927, partial [Actinostola sp. cb2023]
MHDVQFTPALKTVAQYLKLGGATKEFYISDLVTHVLSDTCEFALAGEAKEYNLPVVTIPCGDLSKLWAMITFHGGKCQLNLTPSCTHHLVVPQATGAMHDGKKVITAHWLNDVLTEKKMLVPSRPLHLPVPFPYKIPQCKTMVHSLIIIIIIIIIIFIVIIIIITIIIIIIIIVIIIVILIVIIIIIIIIFIVIIIIVTIIIIIVIII